MSGQLRTEGGGGGPERCALCGGLAAGPCARCHRSMCGDCVVLSEGGVKTFAVCVACERRGGASLSGGWLTVLWWVVAPVAVLAAIAAALIALR